MAESKTKLNEVRAKWLARFMNNYLVLRTYVGLSFFVFAFAFFVFVLRLGGDFGRLAIVIYGLILLGLCKILVFEYVLKTINLQRVPVVKSYSAIVSANTVLGLIMPLIYFNVILAVVMKALASMTNYNTFFCQVRMSLVNFYYNIELYAQINTLIFWLVIFTAVLFLFGGLAERIYKRA